MPFNMNNPTDAELVALLDETEAGGTEWNRGYLASIDQAGKERFLADLLLGKECGWDLELWQRRSAERGWHQGEVTPA